MALLTDDMVDGLDVSVDTFDATVTLHGTVGSDAEKARAEEKARAVAGVSEVRNLLAVVPPSMADQVRIADAEVRTDVAAVLERDAALEDSAIEVRSVNDGIVVLGGEAKTLSDHRRALEDARAVQGVRQVASQIRSPDRLGDEEIQAQSDAALGDGLRQSAYDAWITSKAKAAMLLEPRLGPLAINVDTRHGIVTLFGPVESQRLKEKAGDRVRSLDGVRSVRNELQVVPEQVADQVARDDEKLLDRVEEKIARPVALDDSDISVEVSNGVVRLSGTVADTADRLAAILIARSTPGVSTVIDSLEVRTSAS
jgi:hyperosmotically inducible protein